MKGGEGGGGEVRCTGGEVFSGLESSLAPGGFVWLGGVPGDFPSWVRGIRLAGSYPWAVGEGPDRPHHSMRNISQFASGFAIGSSLAKFCDFFYGGPPLAALGDQTFTSSQLLASTVGGASSWRRRVSPHPISPLALGIGSSSSRGKAASHP